MLYIIVAYDAASRPAASIAQPTASLPLCPRNYGRGLVIYAKNVFKSCYTKFDRKLKNMQIYANYLKKLC